VLLAVLSTPTAAPVIAAARLRRGATSSAAGAAHLITQALGTARRAGATGLVTLRADSAYYRFDVVDAARRAGARFSVTARMDKAVRRAITTIGESAWRSIKYPNAIWDEAENRWISEAEVAETTFTAFTSRRKPDHVTARLIVRRVKRLGPKSVPAGQGELFATWRYHAVFTDSTLSMLDAEATHRDHALVEQVIAELKDGPLAHLPSGKFTANGAWTALAAISFNLTRAAGALASKHHARARLATIRTHPPDQHPGPHLHHRPTLAPPPPPRLALGPGLDRPARREPHPDGDHRHYLINRPETGTRKHPRGNTGQTGHTPTPTSRNTQQENESSITGKPARWIQAQVREKGG
jgi:hypothetical protein